MAEETPDTQKTSQPPLPVKIPGAQISGNIKIIAEREIASSPLSCAVLPERSEVAIGRSNGAIEVLNSENFLELKQFKSSKELPTTFLSAFKPKKGKQMLLSSFASGETVMWDTESGEEIWRVEEDRQSLVNGFNYDYNKFAVGGSDAKITVYDVDDQKLTQVLQGSMDPEIMDGHTMRIFSLRFHPTRWYELISGGWDNTVQFWDIREPFSSRKVRGTHICGDGIDFIDDNKFITASWKKKDPLQIWDYRMGKLIDNIKPDEWNCFLYCCQHVEAASLLLVGGSHKNMIRVIDISTFKSLASVRDLPGAVYFAKKLPKRDTYKTNICFCSDKSIYSAEFEV